MPQFGTMLRGQPQGSSKGWLRPKLQQLLSQLHCSQLVLHCPIGVSPESTLQLKSLQSIPRLLQSTSHLSLFSGKRIWRGDCHSGLCLGRTRGYTDWPSGQKYYYPNPAKAGVQTIFLSNHFLGLVLKTYDIRKVYTFSLIYEFPTENKTPRRRQSTG